MPRHVVLAQILAHAVAVAVLAAIVTSKHARWPRLTKADRVKEGMTRAEVYEVMGGPPGHYFNPESWPSPRSWRVTLHNEESWVFNDGALRVGFSNDGVAVVVWLDDIRRSPMPSWWHHFQWRVTNDPFAWAKG